MKASDLFVRCLEREGVEVIFGLPGEENADLLLSLENSSIRFVLCRHEQAAAFMADAYGRLTGKAGVCLGTLGPGATNLVTGVANGNMDRSPMVVITGQASRQSQHKETHQAMDVVEMFRPLTKWSTSLIHEDTIPEVVRKAFKLAQREKPGACLIELPEDVAARETDARPLTPNRQRRPVPDDKIIDEALAVLRGAQRPILIAGNGAIRTRAARQLRRFVEASGIGCVSTFMGKGAIDRDDPRCLFTIGLQSRDHVACAVDEADLVVTVGYDMVEYPPSFWNTSGDKPVLHLDFLPAEVDEHYPVAVEVVGDLAHALWMMNERLAREPLSFDLPHQRAVRETMLAEFAEHAGDDTTGTIRPQKAIWDARAVLGPGDVLLSDVGAHKMWVARYYQCHEPNTCLIPNGFCSMGFALPGAIAAKLVHPDRRVLAICGDGGFLMNIQDLETACRIGTPIVVMVWEDGGYGLISWKQDNHFGRHTDLSFTNPDVLALAKAFGCRGMRVERSRDLAPALEEAFSCDVPVLISIPIDYQENPKLTQRLGEIACPI